MIALPLLLTQPGCAIHYYNADTGVEHLIGFGHMKMKVSEPNEGVRAVVRGTETLGLALGTTQEGPVLTAGWSRSTRLYVEDDTTVRFEGRGSNLFSVKVGTAFPLLDEEPPQAVTRKKVISQAKLRENANEAP